MNKRKIMLPQARVRPATISAMPEVVILTSGSYVALQVSAKSSGGLFVCAAE
jgi:hypothetical protein